LCLALTAWALASSLLSLDPTRVVLYALAMAGLLVTLLFRSDDFSLYSFAMLASLYLPFVGCMKVTNEQYYSVLDLFQHIAMFIALCGVVQFSLQFIVNTEWMFPFDHLLPNSFFIPSFNLRIPVGDGYEQLKSTGVWFLEPSHFSQTLAFALIIELANFQRKFRLAALAVAYLVSFSGTGFLLLLALALPTLVRARRYFAAAATTGMVLLAPALQDFPPFSFFFARADEFTNPLASGSMRFLAPYWWLGDQFFPYPDRVLMGFGPGNVEAALATTDYAVQDSSWLKLLAEYGLIGTIPFLVFYTYVIFRHSPDRLLSAACALQFGFLGGYLNSFYIQFFHLALVGWPRLADAVHTPMSVKRAAIIPDDAAGWDTSTPADGWRR
jgi:hypothetical protein